MCLSFYIFGTPKAKKKKLLRYYVCGDLHSSVYICICLHFGAEDLVDDCCFFLELT